MGVIRSLDISDINARDEMLRLVERNPNTEVAFALGGVVRGTTGVLKNILEYDGAHKEEGQVSFDNDVAQRTHKKIISKNLQVIGKGHDHLEDKGHAHSFSDQDKETIAQQKEDLHLLAYKTEDVSVQMKVVNTDMQPIPLYVHGVRMDIAETFDDGKVEEHKEAA